MNFEIGEVPNGWKQGDPLIIWPTVKGTTVKGCVMQDAAALGLHEYTMRGNLSRQIASCSFTEQDVPKVDAWLKWWRSPA